MEQIIKKHVKWMKWDRIITAVLAIALGLLFVLLPEGSANTLCTLSGVLLVAAGVTAIAAFIAYGYFFSGYSLVAGILLILAGIFCFVSPGTVQGLLTVILGVFILLSGSASLVDAIACARAKAQGWLVMLLLSLLVIVLGAVVMLGTFDTIMIFAGCSLMVDGVCSLVLTLVFSRRIREARRQLHDLWDMLDE